MADTYANWAALAAANVAGVDYRLDVTSTLSAVAHIAIHGGSLESGTSELAQAAAALNSQRYYSMVSLKPDADTTLHLTSTHYDEPQGVALVKAACYCVSYHGKAGTGSTTFMGGGDTVRKLAVGAALAAAGFTVDYGVGSELDGSDLGNIANRTRRRAGVQLEIERGLRDTLLATPAQLSAYAAAVASVTGPLG